MMMIEESCRLAIRALVFEPNTDRTWAVARSMVENYLNQVWKRGGLAGAKPEDAVFVQCGLGQTMTQADIDDGVLIMTIGVAVSRPAEFIVITLRQLQTT